MNKKLYVGKKVSDFERYDDERIDGVEIVLDSEGSVVTAGDMTGHVLTIECPYGTKEMAEDILAQVSGHVYQGYRAENADLLPEAELGDGVTVNGIYSMLAYRKIEFGPGHMSEMAAPGESEIESEYPYISPIKKEINRKIAQTRSYIEKTAEEIRIGVEKLEDGTQKQFADITLKLDGISSRVGDAEGNISTITQNVSSISSSIKNINGDISKIQQDISNITLSVENEGTSSYISLDIGGTTIKSPAITLTGYVTFASLEEEGQTTINGGNITTGTIQGVTLKSIFDKDAGLIVCTDYFADSYRLYNADESDYEIRYDEYVQVGGLRFDNMGWGDDAAERMFLYTNRVRVDGENVRYPLKLFSAGDMSLEAYDGMIWINSNMTIGANEIWNADGSYAFVLNKAYEDEYRLGISHENGVIYFWDDNSLLGSITLDEA